MTRKECNETSSRIASFSSRLAAFSNACKACNSGLFCGNASETANSGHLSAHRYICHVRFCSHSNELSGCECGPTDDDDDTTSVLPKTFLELALLVVARAVNEATSVSGPLSRLMRKVSSSFFFHGKNKKQSSTLTTPI